MDSNKPLEDTLYDTEEDDNKVTEITVQKMQNAALFLINKEDHTLGNMLRKQLLMDDKVLFAGYRAPHPLEHRIEIKVQTSGESTPRDAVIGALTNLQTQLQTLKSQFLLQVGHFKSDSVNEI